MGAAFLFMVELAEKILATRHHNRKQLKKADRLIKRGDEVGAERIWRKFLEESPDDPIILFNLGVLLKDWGSKAPRGRREELYHEAGGYFSKIVCHPFAEVEHKADSMNNLGIIAEKSGYTDKALTAYKFALRFKPDHGAAMINCGDSLRCLGDFEGANEMYKKVIKAHPKSDEAHFCAGFLALLFGDYERGWKEYQYRKTMKAATTKPIVTMRPAWNGEPLEGKTLMLTEEQGYGDGFMAIRFAPAFVKMGARVVWGAQESMREIMRGAAGISECVSRDDATEFDYHLPVFDAPYWLGITPMNIPQPPYMRICDDWPKWEAPEASGKPRIGLIWAGSTVHSRDRSRSVAPELLQPLIDSHPEFDFYSVQAGKGNEVQRLNGITDLLPTIKAGWTSTAQIFEWLDLLISVDSGPIHLAGALNRPAFLLCPHSPDWRWFLGRTDSPWYPHLRLFRQPAQNDWRTPISEVNEALKVFKR